MRPLGRHTRAISRSAATGLGKVHKVREETTVSKLRSGKASVSPSMIVNGMFSPKRFARLRAIANIAGLRSIAVIWQPLG